MVANKRSEYLSNRSIDRSFRIGMPIAGIAVAGAIWALPAASLDLLIWRLWLPHLFAAATPPIGATGRTLLALAGGMSIAALAFAPLAVRALTARMTQPKRPIDGDVPVLRRADAHPDAPARRPIRASADLGPPLPIKAIPEAAAMPEPEQPLPADLDQPLAAFDPIAIPAAPREPVRAVAPLAPVVPRPALIDPGERFETFDLTPVTRSAPAPVADPTPVAVPAPEPEVVALASLPTATIGTLLDRLERAAPRRATPQPAPKVASLDETLGMLRRLAAG